MRLQFAISVCVIAGLVFCNAGSGCQLSMVQNEVKHQIGQPPADAANPDLRPDGSSGASWLTSNSGSPGSTDRSFKNQQGPRKDHPRRPPVGWRAEWITDPQCGLATTDVHATVPLLGLAGSPPPLIKVGFAYTDLFAADSVGIPRQLFEYSIGMTWIRPCNHRWTVLSMVGAGMATDNQNRSSDAWQFRGGVFGIYEHSPQWKWTFGALATGREDLPVIPAVGVVWQPDRDYRVDLTFPRPQFNWLISENGTRQQWAFFGAGINGTTWACESAGMVDDRLTYRDLRVVAGWESRPTSNSGMPVPMGKTLRAEIGYAVARQFEFENENRQQDLEDSFLMGITTKF